MSRFIYHMVPREQVGNFLHPLNELQHIPELKQVYKTQMQKYKGREHICEQRISPLKCKWNDVLHFTPIHPRLVREAMIAEGCDWREVDWYKVPIDKLDFDKLCIFTHEYVGPGPSPDEDFVKYSEEALKSYIAVPERTRDYYHRFCQNKPEGLRRPLVFVGIAHVLYKGAIDTSTLERITL